MILLVTKKMIEYFDKDIKRINHALKVYGFATCLASNEIISDEKLFILNISAILHDIGIKEAEKKYGSNSGHYQEIEGPAVASWLLRDLNIEKPILDRILFLIGNHHSYNKIDAMDFQVLVEADFLVNFFEDNMQLSAIEKIQKNIFKTKTGISMVESMYLG
jgi:hypothetical protein